MRIGRLARPLALACLGGLAVSGSGTNGQAQGQDGHAGSVTAQHGKPTREQNALVKAVREANARFKQVTSIEGPGEGYGLMFGCVSGGDFGAMGLHYVNLSLVDGNIDVMQPEIILFEPAANGRIRITGADYLCARGRVGCGSPRRGTAATHGPAVPPLRKPQPIRAARVLYASCVGVERQSQRLVHQLEPCRLV